MSSSGGGTSTPRFATRNISVSPRNSSLPRRLATSPSFPSAPLASQRGMLAPAKRPPGWVICVAKSSSSSSTKA